MHAAMAHQGAAAVQPMGHGNPTRCRRRVRPHLPLLYCYYSILLLFLLEFYTTTVYSYYLGGRSALGNGQPRQPHLRVPHTLPRWPFRPRSGAAALCASRIVESSDRKVVR